MQRAMTAGVEALQVRTREDIRTTVRPDESRPGGWPRWPALALAAQRVVPIPCLPRSQGAHQWTISGRPSAQREDDAASEPYLADEYNLPAGVH